MGNKHSYDTNNKLIDSLLRNNFLDSTKQTDKNVELALRVVDRRRFTYSSFPVDRENEGSGDNDGEPGARRGATELRFAKPESIYSDSVWRSGDNPHLHISAPCIYANVLKTLDLNASSRFLNIGSGTGYLSSLAGFIMALNPTNASSATLGVNDGIEIHADCVHHAYQSVLRWHQEVCSEHHSLLAGPLHSFCRPRFFVADAFSVESALKYDRIYIGAEVDSRQLARLAKEFAAPGCIIVCPHEDSLMRFEMKSGDDFRREDFAEFAQRREEDSDTDSDNSGESSERRHDPFDALWKSQQRVMSVSFAAILDGPRARQAIDANDDLRQTALIRAMPDLPTLQILCAEAIRAKLIPTMKLRLLSDGIEHLAFDQSADKHVSLLQKKLDTIASKKRRAERLSHQQKIKRRSSSSESEKQHDKMTWQEALRSSDSPMDRDHDRLGVGQSTASSSAAIPANDHPGQSVGRVYDAEGPASERARGIRGEATREEPRRRRLAGRTFRFGPISLVFGGNEEEATSSDSESSDSNSSCREEEMASENMDEGAIEEQIRNTQVITGEANYSSILANRMRDGLQATCLPAVLQNFTMLDAVPLNP